MGKSQFTQFEAGTTKIPGDKLYYPSYQQSTDATREAKKMQYNRLYTSSVELNPKFRGLAKSALRKAMTVKSTAK